MNNSGSSSSSTITALVPGGVVTTQNISTVIKPKENNNSMQFVKIQTPELSKKAVEQIRVAQESKITKDKIKEVEEEWQSNLLNWKSKRRQQFVGVHPSKNDHDQGEQNNNEANNENGRKIKTFAEMIEQRAKAGNRLNFHLERYIGSSEDDYLEEDDDDDDHHSRVNGHDQHGRPIETNNNINDSNNVSSTAINDNNNVLVSTDGEDVVDKCTQQSHRSKNINISNNNLIQKEKPAHINDIVSDQSISINEHISNVGAHGAGDSVTNKNGGVKFNSQENLEQEEEDEEDGDEDDNYDNEEQYSELQQQPINSTFIKGIEQPLTPPTNQHSNVSIRPPLDRSMTDPRFPVNLVENAKFDSVGQEDEQERGQDEADDEQEGGAYEELEEQKQLQRIAFVQKLKAFEKMTKPSMPETRFVPTRATNKPPPPLPPQPAPARSSTTTSQPPAASIISPPPPPPPPPPPQPAQTRLSSATNTVVQMPPRPRPKLQHRAETTHVSPVPRPPPQPHPPLQTIQRVVEPKQDLPLPMLPQVPSNIISSKTTIPQPPPPPRARPRTPSPSTQPKQQTPRQPTKAPILTPSIAPVSPPQRQKQQAPQPKQPVTPRQQLGQQQQQQQQQLPQQTSPLRSREEKSQDGTVLSVSGKKRCSSCKEELGRGAAAFVIESLNLVYHTNCFRCSVCHVNLSNGFRGVDVRVHAGALHCQNCYSKDGLNYSRV